MSAPDVPWTTSDGPEWPVSDEMRDLIAHWRELKPRSTAQNMLRAGLGGQPRRRLETWKGEMWDVINPEVFHDQERFESVGGMPLRRPGINGLTYCTWLRPEMQLTTSAFEFYDGYLALGTFAKDVAFEKRMNPVDERDIDQQVASAGPGALRMFKERGDVEFFLKNIPWLKYPLQDLGNRYPGRTVRMTVIVDADHNAILLRTIEKDEIIGKGFEEVEGADEGSYFIPMAAVAPHMGATLIADASVHDTSFTPVVWVHTFRERQEHTVYEKDGSFDVVGYLHYQDTLSANESTRLPTHMGFPGFYISMVPRLDADQDVHMDMDSITCHHIKGPYGHDALLGPQKAIEDGGKRIFFELGLFAILDHDSNSWKHTYLDVHWYYGKGRYSYTLVEDPLQYTTHGGAMVFATGYEICSIDAATSVLTRNELLSGEALMDMLMDKIQRTLPDSVNVLGSFARAARKGHVDAQFWTKQFNRALSYGFYSSVSDPVSELDLTYANWDRQPMVQIRNFYTYISLHALLVDAPRSSHMNATEFNDQVSMLDKAAIHTFLNTTQREADRAAEMRRKGKLKAQFCDPRVKEALEAWDNAMKAVATPAKRRRLLQQWGPGGQAVLDVMDNDPHVVNAGKGKKVRDGESFFAFLQQVRGVYAKHCTPEEWRDRVLEHLDRETERQKQEDRTRKLEAKKEEAAVARKAELQEKNAAAATARSTARQAAQRAAEAAAAAELQAAQAANFTTVEEHKAALAKAAENAAKLQVAQAAGFQTIGAYERAESDRRIEEKRLEKEAKAAAAAERKKAKADQGKQLVGKAKKAVQQTTRNMQAAAAAAAQAPEVPQVAAERDEEEEDDDVERALVPVDKGKGKGRKGGRKR